MKIFFIIFLLFFAFEDLFSQNSNTKLNQFYNEFAVCISSEREQNFENLDKLKRAIGNKRIVFLGEAVHTDQSILVEKQKIIEYLHDSLGFNVLIEELPFYPYNLIVNKSKSQTELHLIYNILNGNEEMSVDQLRRIEYVWKTWVRGDSLQIKGLDIHIGFFSNSYVNYLDSLVEVHEPGVRLELDWQHFLSLIKKRYLSAEELLFVDSFVNSVITKMPLHQEGFLIVQLLKNASGYLNNEYYRPSITNKDLKGKYYDYIYFRDKQMADNLLYYLEKVYPTQKVIVSASNYHIARNIEPIRSSIKEFRKGVPMGQYVWDNHKDDIYSLAILSAEGEMGFIAKACEIKPRDRSAFKKIVVNEDDEYLGMFMHTKKAHRFALESFILKSACQSEFIDFTAHSNELKDLGPFLLMPTFSKPIKHQWQETYDGIIMLQKAVPVELKSIYTIYPDENIDDLNSIMYQFHK
jgi:erythromycin esterase